MTFLFTDIEGSTRLWEEQPAQMEVALARHDEILRSAIEAHAGHVFSTGGDGFAAAFARSDEAVLAAVQAQRQLAGERWPDGCPIRVRMGVHTGEASERDGDYFGTAVNRAARIMSEAQPEQILISAVTQSVGHGTRDELWSVVPAGEVDIRGSAETATVFQVCAPGLPQIDLAPPSRGPAGNLEVPLTSLVGRAEELSAVLGAVEEHRLVTLIGVGGVGKTRLAMEAALESRLRSDGHWIAELGLIDRPDEVASALADALRIRQAPGLSIEQSVVQWCVGRDLLLVIDNCEHVLRGAASMVKRLIAGARGVTVVATSREPLMIPGEHVYPVPSLSLPSEDGSGAVDLFVQRARAEMPSFDPSVDVAALHDICERLDGIPLALELAAARTRGLSLEAIASRLDERFRLLTGGRRATVERHATLRATVDWSYELLDEDDKALFNRLSVFAGPFTLEDAVAISGDDIDELETVDTLSGLVDRSLVVRDGRSPEYRLLETLRSYGRELVAEAGELDELRQAHANVMARKAAAGRVDAHGPREGAVVAGLQAQMSDFGAAVEWCIGAERPALGVRIAEDFCLAQTNWVPAEPARWLQDLSSEAGSEEWRTRALWITSMSAAFYEGDLERAESLALRAVALSPRHCVASVMATFTGMLSGRAGVVLERSARAMEAVAQPADQLMAFIARGHALFQLGHLDEAEQVAARFTAWALESQRPTAIAMARHLDGRILAERGNDDDALEQFEAGLAATRGLEAWTTDANLRREMIPIMMRRDPVSAVSAARDMVEACLQHNDTGQINNAFAYITTILSDVGDDALAARLVGHVGVPLLSPGDGEVYERTRAALSNRLGNDYDALVRSGRETAPTDMTRQVLDALTRATPA